MITIENKKKGIEFEINNKHHDVIFEPFPYNDKPFVKLTIDKFDFSILKERKKSYKIFFDDFGSNNLNWIIRFNSQSYRLDLSSFKNNIYGESLYQIVWGNNFNGTKFIFKLHDLPVDFNELKILLKEAIEIEDYEKCSKIRDLLIQ